MEEKGWGTPQKMDHSKWKTLILMRESLGWKTLYIELDGYRWALFSCVMLPYRQLCGSQIVYLRNTKYKGCYSCR